MFSEKKGALDSTPEFTSLIRGRVDLFSLSSFVYVIIFMLFFTTWEQFFPSETALLRNMWAFAISGALLHEFAWGSEKDWIFSIKKKVSFNTSSLRSLIPAVGLTFFSVLIMQLATVVIIGAKEKIGISMLQVMPAIGVNLGAAIVEEWIFSWCTFTFFYFVSRGNLPICLLANGITFALFHSAVKFILYGGQGAFLPAIFVSRVMLDMLYYFSEGRISAPMAVHLMVNGMRVFV